LLKCDHVTKFHGNWLKNLKDYMLK